MPVIHVGGTSGKGSTATTIASILRASGRSTLLHTSPYLQVATEKLQIDGRLIDVALFSELTREVIDAANLYGQTHLTYGEAWMTIVGLAMARLKPDVAVIEVGAGGRFDLTNVVDSSVAVITTVGIDHTETLGKTIPAIAWHKAGIIKPGHAVVHGVEQPEARAEIDRQAASVGPGSVRWIDVDQLDVMRGDDGHATWRDPVTGARFASPVSRAGHKRRTERWPLRPPGRSSRVWRSTLSSGDLRRLGLRPASSGCRNRLRSSSTAPITRRRWRP